jgi:hypothetical protein
MNLYKFEVADVKRFNKTDLEYSKHAISNKEGAADRAMMHFAVKAGAANYDKTPGSTPASRNETAKRYLDWARAARIERDDWRRQGARVTGEQLRRNKTILQADEPVAFAHDENNPPKNYKPTVNGLIDVLEYIQGAIDGGKLSKEQVDSGNLIIKDIEAELDALDAADSENK